MERKYRITIPEPCTENWDKMIPNKEGRFCLSCSKTVIDFTSMLPEEIQHFFVQNKNEKVCGRFKKSQLDFITIQIPSHVLHIQTHYKKMFLLALFITMGTTLFSCADKDGNKKKIDKIEVVESNKSKQVNTEKVVKENNDSTSVAASQKIAPIKSVPANCTKITYNEEKSSSKTNDKKGITQDSIVEDDMYVTGAAIETVPYYPGGIENFYQFFISEFKLPEEVECPKTRIIVSFVIEKDGSLSSFDFSKNTNPKIGKEIERVLKQAPKWKSGTQNGKKTRTKYSMPIAIK